MTNSSTLLYLVAIKKVNGKFRVYVGEMDENMFFICNLKSSLVDLLIYFTTSIVVIIRKHA